MVYCWQNADCISGLTALLDARGPVAWALTLAAIGFLVWLWNVLPSDDSGERPRR